MYIKLYTLFMVTIDEIDKIPYVSVNDIIDRGLKNSNNDNNSLDIKPFDHTSKDDIKRLISYILSASNKLRYQHYGKNPSSCLVSPQLAIALANNALYGVSDFNIDIEKPARHIIGSMAGLIMQTSSLMTDDTATVFYEDDDDDPDDFTNYYTIRVN